MASITYLVYNHTPDVGGTTTAVSFSTWPDKTMSGSSYHAQDTNEINPGRPFFPAQHYGRNGPTCYLHKECAESQYIHIFKEQEEMQMRNNLIGYHKTEICHPFQRSKTMKVTWILR